MMNYRKDWKYTVQKLIVNGPKDSEWTENFIIFDRLLNN